MALQKIESEISDDDVETAFYINPVTGKIQFRKTGDVGVILFDDEEAARARDTIMIHNHPRGTAPSSEDFFFALAQGTDESHVYHENGRYIMRFNPEMNDMERGRLRESFFTEKAIIKPAVDRAYRAGEISDNEAWIALHGGTLEKVEARWPSLFDYSVEDF